MLAGSLMAVLAWGAVPMWGPWLVVPAGGLTVLALFVFYFFRDPQRPVPAGDGLVLSPGDGKIIDIREVEEPSFFAGRCRRITIFLSVFDVHVQRAPLSGHVAHRDYRSGQYLVAWHPKASGANEQASLGLRTQWGPVLVRQIAGLIARRIVTYPEPGDHVQVGERIGLIRFGSRVDLFIPVDWPLSCAVGDRAVGGTTVFAHVGGRPEKAAPHQTNAEAARRRAPGPSPVAGNAQPIGAQWVGAQEAST